MAFVLRRRCFFLFFDTFLPKSSWEYTTLNLGIVDDLYEQPLTPLAEILKKSSTWFTQYQYDFKMPTY